MNRPEDRMCCCRAMRACCMVSRLPAKCCQIRSCLLAIELEAGGHRPTMRFCYIRTCGLLVPSAGPFANSISNYIAHPVCGRVRAARQLHAQRRLSLLRTVCKHYRSWRGLTQGLQNQQVALWTLADLGENRFSEHQVAHAGLLSFH